MATPTAPHTPAMQASERSKRPPVVVFLPGIIEAEHNTSLRVAELIAADLTEGPGTFAVEPVPADGGLEGATDHYRVIRVGDGPIMDLCTADYRPALRRRSVTGDGLWTWLRQLVWALWYFLRSARLVYGARRRAKSRLARAQLMLGSGAAVLLFLGVLATGYAVGVALGLWGELVTTSERIEDAIAVGICTARWWAPRPAPAPTASSR